MKTTSLRQTGRKDIISTAINCSTLVNSLPPPAYSKRFYGPGKVLQTLLTLAALVPLLFFTGCPNPVDNAPKETGVTYTVTADGNEGTTTTALTFAFSEAVNLTAADIFINGNGVTKDVLTGRGTSWSLTLNVSMRGNITVAIAKAGIESGPKSVAVYVAGQSTRYTITANGGAGTTTDALAFDFTAPVSLTAEDINITSERSGVTPDALSGGGTSWSLALNVSTAQVITVSIRKAGIESGRKPVTVYVADQDVPLTGYTVTADRDANTGTVALAFTFSAPVSLTAEDINITSESGGVTPDALTGGGTNWSLALNVDTTQSITVRIDSTGIESGPKSVMVYVLARYTVTFDKGEGGGSAPASRIVDAGTEISLPGQGNMTAPAGKRFAGWESGGVYYWDGNSRTVNADVAFTARWLPQAEAMPDGLSLADSLAWIRANAEEGGDYTITLHSGETIAPYNELSYNGENIRITLKGDAVERTVRLSETGRLFTVGSGVTLILDNNITLQGRSDNTESLVQVNNGATLVMKAGSKIRGNTLTASYTRGGGVYVNGGTFTMSDGEISGNTADRDGGGVLVSVGEFTMNGGTISGNTATSEGGGVHVVDSTFTMNGGIISGNTTSDNRGDGVYMTSGEFTMSGGEISGNTGGGVFVYSGNFTMKDGTISDSTSGSGVFLHGGAFTMNNGTISGNTGGGVLVSAGEFTMNGGTINGNTANNGGGGVFVSDSGVFAMSGGEISGNTANNGGGVYVALGGRFTMNNGTISNNIASSDGGGVYVAYVFNMNDGTISGNTASGNGGGVYVDWGRVFTKQAGGIIYGSDAIDTLKNTATNGNGHAVYVVSSPAQKRNTTAGEGVTLDSEKDGAAGGWEDSIAGQYTVTFDADGGIPAMQTWTVDEGGSAMPEEPSKTGYTFGGWYTSTNGWGSPFTDATPVTGDITVYAKWTANAPGQYTVTFNADGGSPATQTKTANSGSSVGSLPSNPTRANYTFGGWYTSTNGGGSPFTATTPVTGDTTVYAKWMANAPGRYTVTFNADGGSPATQTLTVNSGESLGSGIGNIEYSSVSGGAAWTLLGDGRRQSPAIGDNGLTKSRINFATYAANESITIRLEVSSEQGYDKAFISTLDNANATSGSGYYTGSLISGTQSVSVTIPVPTAGGHFIDIGYGKDGSDSGGSDCAWFTVTSSDSGNSPTQPTRSGYTFGGWYTSTGGGGSPFTGSTPVTGDITVYAKWTANAPSQYTVTFSHGEGGGWAPANRTVYAGEAITFPGQGSMTAPVGKIFDGWENGGTSYQEGHIWTVSADVIFTARWMTPPVPGNLSLADSLAWLNSSAIDGGDYTITLKGNETIAPQQLSYSGKTVSITLTGGADERKVSLSGKGSLFTVGSGVTLILDNKVTLQGLGDNNAPLVKVGGKLEMNAGSKISGNTITSRIGGGVYVDSNGTFTMSGGTISGNTVSTSGIYACGGGVYVYSNGTFTMSGGTISGNSAFSSIRGGCGGGVYVDSNGTFTMSGGTISGNTASSSDDAYGGGVYVGSSNGTFTMSGGEISGNTASASGNYAHGGGVYVYGTFTMSGGEISGNTSSSDGGGVYVYSNGTFTKQGGGIIYGQDASNTALRNTARGFRSGHAVYVWDSDLRNSTAGNGVTLYSKVSEAAGGWVDTVPANLPFSEALKWFGGSSVTESEYTFTLNRDETIAPSLLSTGNPVSITIQGDTVERTVSLSETGSLFIVGGNVTLILGNNITLQGRSDNTDSLVRVGGTLVMETGSKITGNTTSGAGGGGVYVNRGEFTMSGGTISGNTANNGGGGGGGVFVDDGWFTMSGGTISGNTANNGGGVYVAYVFNMNDGTISGNTASGNGGGVYVDVDGFGSLVKQGGIIYGSNATDTLKNTATNGDGHAAYVDSSPVKIRNTTAGEGVTLSSAGDYNWD